MNKRALLALAGIGGVALFLLSRQSEAMPEYEEPYPQEPWYPEQHPLIDPILQPQYPIIEEPYMPAVNWKVNEYPKYATFIRETEDRYGIPRDLLARQLYQESAFLPEVITGARRSSVGATGIAQFMPLTGEDYGLVEYDLPRGHVNRKIIRDDRLDPYASIDAAGRYDRVLYRMFNNWKHALMAYNWGPGNVGNWLRGARLESAVPAETSRYAALIFGDVPVIG